jgi:hypothetical protein
MKEARRRTTALLFSHHEQSSQEATMEREEEVVLRKEANEAWEEGKGSIYAHMLAGVERFGPDLVVVLNSPQMLTASGKPANLIVGREWVREHSPGDAIFMALTEKSATEAMGNGLSYIWAFFYGLPSSSPDEAFGVAMPLPQEPDMRCARLVLEATNAWCDTIEENQALRSLLADVDGDKFVVLFDPPSPFGAHDNVHVPRWELFFDVFGPGAQEAFNQYKKYSDEAHGTGEDGKYIWALFWKLPSIIPGKPFGFAMPLPPKEPSEKIEA